MAEPEALLDLFVENNIAFVGDDLAQESRQFRTPGPSEGPAIQRLAQRIIDMQGGCLLFDCGRSKGEFLAKLIEESKAQALVVCMMKFCDPEGMDYPRYRAELEDKGVKMLYLEIEQQMESVEALRTRIQSFVEMF
jgi:benzoyl-CoA reductase/2-hydroxyglutaryl-CoA dehydratase subunit BcrC/BadD/HgdB